MLTVSRDDLGTPEAVWLAGDRLRRLPAMRWPDVRRVVIVAPHPDDEVLGAGGSLRYLARRGASVHVASVTDGEASHPGSTMIPPTALAERRRLETTDALDELGIDEPTLYRLAIPDGRVGDHEHTLATSLTTLLDERSLCIVTWRRDGHPDHEATGRAAAVAARLTGAHLVEYPVWMWHWAEPSSPAVPWLRARRFDIAPVDQTAKCAAIAAFTSQIHPIGPAEADQPVLPPAVLARFQRSFEVFFEPDDGPHGVKVPGP